MSKLLVCAVFDKAVEAYSTPVFVRHVGEAVRSFSDEVQNPNSMLCKHPSDYVLYLLGSFDPSNGLIYGEAPSTLITAAQCVMPPVQPE